VHDVALRRDTPYYQQAVEVLMKTFRVARPAPLVLAALLAGPVGADVLTVDDDGPAEYSQLVDAIEAAAPGDVILVEPGNYSNPGGTLEIDKPLTILGKNAGPHFADCSFGIRLVADVPFTMARVDALSFTASEITSRIRLQGCRLRRLDLTNCSQVQVMRGRIVDSEAIIRGASHVSLTGVEIVGGASSTWSYDGINVITVGGRDPNVVVAGCDVVGGSTNSGGWLGTDGGNGIVALTLTNSVSLRGSSFHVVKGGFGDGGVDGSSLVGKIVYSGVITGAHPASTLVDPPEPYLDNTSSFLGQTATVDLFGVAGQPALLLGSASTITPFELPGLDGGPLWIDPSAIALLQAHTLAGQDVPTQVTFSIPDEEPLLGLTFDLQALVLMPSGSMHMTNPGQFIVRP